MSLVSYSIPNLAQGVSQQPDAQRDPSQGEIQVNGMSSIVEGLRKRDPSQTLALVSSTDFGDCFIHEILRDNVEEYLAVITNSSIKVFDLDGNSYDVDAETGAYDYLSTVTDPKAQIRAVTIADYTFITNTLKKPAMMTGSSNLAPAVSRPRDHEALVWIKAATYGQKYVLQIGTTKVEVSTAVAPVVVDSTATGGVRENRISSEDIAERLMNGMMAGSINKTTSEGGNNSTTDYLTDENPIVKNSGSFRADVTTDGSGTGLKLDGVMDGTSITSLVIAAVETPTRAEDHGIKYAIGDKIYVSSELLDISKQDTINTSPTKSTVDYLTIEDVTINKTGTVTTTTTTDSTNGTNLKIDITMNGSAITKIDVADDEADHGRQYAVGDQIKVSSSVLGRSDSINISPTKTTSGFLTNSNPTGVTEDLKADRVETTTDGSGTGLRLDLTMDGSSLDTIEVGSNLADHGNDYAVGDKIYVKKRVLDGGTDDTAVEIAEVAGVSAATTVHIATVKKVDPATQVHIATVKKVDHARDGSKGGVADIDEITRSGSVLWVSSDSAITISAVDARSNADITVILSKVQAFTELPTIAPNNYQVTIEGDPTNSFDDYHVSFAPKSLDSTNPEDTFGEGTWSETVKPGEAYKIDKDTMPHLLIRKPDDRFYFGSADGEFLYGKQVVSVSIEANVTMTLGNVVTAVPTTTDNSGSGLILKKITRDGSNYINGIEFYGSDDSVKDGTNYAVGDKIYVRTDDITAGMANDTPIHIATVTAVNSPDDDLKRPSWGERIAGDTTTTPNPSFIGNAINDIFIYKNRLGFLADENVILSRVRSFFEFFPETVTAVLDTDPIDVIASNNRVSVLKYAVPYQDELILFSSQYQFRFNAAETVLTPATAQITVLTQFEIDTNVRPQLAGGGIIFAQANGDFSQFREFSVRGAGTALTADAQDLTGYVSAFVPSSIHKLTVNDTSNAVFGISNKTGFKNRIYVYKYFVRNTGNNVERAQSSWSYWDLSGADEILQVLCVRETLFTLVRYGTAIYLEKIPVQDRSPEPPTGSPYPLLLDRRISTETTETPTAMCVDKDGTHTDPTKRVVYDADAKTTTWQLPYEAVTTTQAWSGFSESSTGGVLLSTITSGSSITASGDWRNKPIYFGEPYEFRYRFTRFKLYKEIGGGKAAANIERAQVRHAKLRYHETAFFEIEVTAERRDTATYRFDGTVLGVRESLVTSTLPSGGYNSDDDRYKEGIFNIPIMSKGERCIVEIKNDTPHPCKFSTCEWVALVTRRASALR